VLVFDRLSSAVDASLVLGQAGFDVGSLNRGGAPSAATLAAPEGVWSDGTRLFVADTGNHRVLVWNAFPTSNGQPADVILGQDGPTSVLPNRGQDGATATTMSFPSAVRIEGGALFVADTGNNRVLRFNAVTLTSGAAADGVLGQADLSSRASAQTPNDAAHLAGPSALASDGAYLYVADRDLARVVAFALPAAGLGPAPATSLGAPAGLTLSGPSGLAAEATPLFTTRLYVSDTNADRIVILGSLSRLAR
jgi:DNA-binding beta-propeller fold protein YncE